MSLTSFRASFTLSDLKSEWIFLSFKIIEKKRGLPDRGWGRCVSGWRGFPEKDLVKHAPKYYQKSTQSTEWVVGTKKGTKRYTYSKKGKKGTL